MSCNHPHTQDVSGNPSMSCNTNPSSKHNDASEKSLEPGLGEDEEKTIGLNELFNSNTRLSVTITTCPSVEFSDSTTSTTLSLLPSKSGSSLYRSLRWNFFSTYRRLFTIVFVCNLAVVVALLGRQTLTYGSSVTASSTNLLIAILVRQEHFVNTLFLASSSLPLSLPLCVRRQVAKIYSYGGLHSGCGVAAVIWYVAFAGLITDAFQTNRALLPVVILTYVILTLLILILLFAHPAMRMKLHDYFELTHRFAGWTTVALFWAQVLLSADLSRQQAYPPVSLGHTLVTTSTFWCVIIITACLIYPWLWLRLRPVRIEKLSDHAARLHFGYSKLDYCMGIRLSTSPLVETHAFATLPTPNNGDGFSVVISNAGDWTKALIRSPSPRTKIWVKGVPTYGVLRVAVIFKRTAIVATGSGIGPCMSLFNGRKVDCRILWSTPDPMKTYGQDIINRVLATDPEAVIINTREAGRPDMVALTYDLYKRSGAEAVIVISNPRVTRKIVYGMETRGVPAYGPIFDS